MKRKIIQVAGKTMVVSLPLPFVKKYGLEKGEEVDVIEENGQLKIITEKMIDQGQSINIEDIDLAYEQIDILYSCGIDQIKVQVTDQPSIKKIQTMLDLNTPQFEMLTQSGKSCTLQVIASLDADHFDNMLKRIFFMLNQEVDLRRPIQRLLSACFRILHKKGYRDHSSTILMGNMLMGLSQLISLTDRIPAIKSLYDLLYSNKGITPLAEILFDTDNPSEKLVMTSLYNTIRSLRVMSNRSLVAA